MLGGVVGFLGHHGLAVRIGMFHQCWFCSIAASPDIPVTAGLASVTKIYAGRTRFSTVQSRLHRLDDDLGIRVPFDSLQHRLHGDEIRGRAYLLAEVRLQMTLCLKQVRRGIEDITR